MFHYFSGPGRGDALSSESSLISCDNEDANSMGWNQVLTHLLKKLSRFGGQYGSGIQVPTPKHYILIKIMSEWGFQNGASNSLSIANLKSCDFLNEIKNFDEII